MFYQDTLFIGAKQQKYVQLFQRHETIKNRNRTIFRLSTGALFSEHTANFRKKNWEFTTNKRLKTQKNGKPLMLTPFILLFELCSNESESESERSSDKGGVLFRFTFHLTEKLT